jgi:hypothetical protein
MVAVGDDLLKSAASPLRGTRRRRFLAEVCETLCGGNARQAESRFGWGRETIDIRLIVEPHTQSDPDLKTERQYTNLSAAEVRQALLDRGYQEHEVPSERTLRDILNRMNYRLKRIQKGKPLKKTADTDAIFANVKAARQTAAADPECLEISLDTKTKVKLGEYSQGGKNQDGQRRQRPQSPGP